MSRDEAAAVLPADEGVPQQIMFSAPLVDHNYLNQTEQRLIQEAEAQEARYQQFKASNLSAMNVIRLARLGLIASEMQAKEESTADE